MILLDVVLLLAVAIGHTILWVAFVNRTHAEPWPEEILHRLRRIHEVAIVAFPVVLIWCVGLNGPKLLLGGPWTRIGPYWGTLFAICLLGWGRLCWVLTHKVRTRILPDKLRTEHTYVKIADEIGSHPAQPGPYYYMTRFPGNEQFQLDISHKHLPLSRLPERWEGFRILHISDVHLTGVLTEEFYRTALMAAAREPVDLICFTGDLVDEMDCLDWLPRIFAGLDAPFGKFFILGNHDWYQDAELIRSEFMKLGWTNLGSRSETIDIHGEKLIIAGDETPWLGSHPAFESSDAFRLLLAHSPDLFPWAQQQNVDLMLAGHTHGGQIKIPVIGPIYSPSRFGCRYADGTYQEGPTLMHVSRGLAGRHPLRYRCPPEITRLTLHTASELSSSAVRRNALSKTS